MKQPESPLSNLSFTQTYVLASKVKQKLQKDAIKQDSNLRMIILQANMLDKMVSYLHTEVNKKMMSTSMPLVTASMNSVSHLPVTVHDREVAAQNSVLEIVDEQWESDQGDENDNYSEVVATSHRVIQHDENVNYTHIESTAVYDDDSDENNYAYNESEISDSDSESYVDANSDYDDDDDDDDSDDSDDSDDCYYESDETHSDSELDSDLDIHENAMNAPVTLSHSHSKPIPQLYRCSSYFYDD
ncbi:hypothetical protein DFJ63DRAFT_333887 [Scheffersomyces coipomensis]|uniref:uncharacterized protein n=1 Tax=Scheffersomyces coipomensis TaxID=1788519 RepID=UPI00315DE4A2